MAGPPAADAVGHNSMPARLTGRTAEAPTDDGAEATPAPRTAMTGVAAKLNDREIKALSDYVAGLR